MSIIDEALRANQAFAAQFRAGNRPMPPARKLAVLACMDARLNVERALGLDIGDAHVIRNAGGIAEEDAIRSLIISHHLLGTQEFAVINHTDCGMLTFADDELRRRLRSSTGSDPAEPRVFYSFGNLDENVRAQVAKIRAHPWLPKSIPVRGFIYDVNTGRLREVESSSAEAGG